MWILKNLLKLLFCVVLVSLTACGGGTDNDVTVTPPDATPPVITLNGDSTISLFVGESYNELGASANDDRDGTVDVVISGTVDTSTEGNYPLIYTASDSAGNTASVERIITLILPPDTTPPVITLNGDSTITLFVGESYNALGASANDDRDGTVDVVISGTVDTSTEGNYSLTYTASDSIGNTASVTRTVNVVQPDITAPGIILNGDISIHLLLDESYDELGASAIDDRDGSIEVIVSGVVDTSTVGNYSITYTANDDSGNIASITRLIIVATTRPFITTWRTDVIMTWRDDDRDYLSDENQLRIATTGDDYDFQVDWGDGTIDEHVTSTIVHTYASIGTYTIKINGTFPQLYFEGFRQELHDKEAYKLLSIEQWGDIKWQSMHGAFANCRNLVGNASDTPDLSEVSDLSYMLINAKRFNQNIGNWDVSNVTNMSGMFEFANLFNQEIGNWEESNVTDMSDM